MNIHRNFARLVFVRVNFSENIGVFRVNEANLHKLYERRHCEVLVHHVHLAHQNKDEAVQNAFLDDIGAHHGIMRFPWENA